MERSTNPLSKQFVVSNLIMRGSVMENLLSGALASIMRPTAITDANSPMTLYFNNQLVERFGGCNYVGQMTRHSSSTQSAVRIVLWAVV
jgi:hypothetical protein